MIVKSKFECSPKCLLMKCITLTLIALLISVRVGSATFKTEMAMPFSTANMLKIMNQIGIAYPDVVLAQARLETGNFTSKVFKENNNLFGRIKL